jgi:murein DD-endopeptidase MepM/ murein hydrolase activator NlpD
MSVVSRWLLLLALCLPVLAQAALPRAAPVPGGVVLIPLDGAIEAAPPEVWYDARRVLVARDARGWVAVVGVPLGAEPGNHRLEVRRAGKVLATHSFTVGGKEYATQRITLQNRRMVDPDPEDLKRIAGERAEINRALDEWSERAAVSLAFDWPAEGRISSPFGLRRYFNEQPRNPHNGLDIAAPTGTPIRAPAEGVVVQTGEYFFNGRSVFLDHGQGLISMFVHMDSIGVHPGQLVERGEVLGTVGMTGRATGPHLHWSVSLNRAMVDPLLFLPSETPPSLGSTEATGVGAAADDKN